MFMKKILSFFSLMLALVISGCNNDIDSTSDSEKINKFIVDGVSELYVWESETDWDEYKGNVFMSDYRHNELFKKLIYKDDKWSLLTDNIGGLANMVDGVSTTFGYSLKSYKNPFTQNNEAIAVVLYVTSGSPADNVGLKRGDIIVEMNGDKITTDNYKELTSSSSLVLRCGILNNEAGNISLYPETKRLIAVQMYENPVNTYSIIEKKGRKIGYLCYTSYQEKSEEELIRVFSKFKSEGVGDVVLDLRYNSGGYSRTAQILSSILAPESVVKNRSVYLERRYNDFYKAYFESRGGANEYFVDTLAVNMNLNRLYVLTSEETASASEATIVGLDPYLDVIQIGGTTSGKYCGGVLVSPESLYGDKYESYYSNISNWGMYIMLYRFANIHGVTSFAAGLIPDIPAEEGQFDLKPFGNEDDPLLGRALAHILGENYVEKRSRKISVPLISLPDIKKPVDGMLVTTPFAVPLSVGL